MGIRLDSLVASAPRIPAPVHMAPMRTEDLDAVMEIERRSFPEPWTPGLFLHELKVPFSKTIVAWRGDELVGYVCRWLVGNEVHILNLAVRPEARQAGIGRSLLALVMDEAARTDASVVTLEVESDNTAAIALYRAFGFTERGLRRHYYARGLHATVMSCDLRPAPPTPLDP